MMQILAMFTDLGSILFYLLLLALLLSWWSRSRRFGIWLGRLVLTAVLLIGLLPIGDWLLRPLEEYFPVPTLPDHVDGIVVLGGAEEPGVMAVRGWPELNGNADRLVAFVSLARRYPEAKLMFTGGSALEHKAGGFTEADVAARIFELLGLDPARVIYESVSRNTAENARNSVVIARPKADETWLLVTSARHMPRAVNCFDAVGWPVLPYPVDYYTSNPPGLTFSPLGRLSGLGFVAKEWLGLLGYWVKGYTNQLLPPRRSDAQKP